MKQFPIAFYALTDSKAFCLPCLRYRLFKCRAAEWNYLLRRVACHSTLGQPDSFVSGTICGTRDTRNWHLCYFCFHCLCNKLSEFKGVCFFTSHVSALLNTVFLRNHIWVCICTILLHKVAFLCQPMVSRPCSLHTLNKHMKGETVFENLKKMMKLGIM